MATLGRNRSADQSAQAEQAASAAAGTNYGSPNINIADIAQPQATQQAGNNAVVEAVDNAMPTRQEQPQQQIGRQQQPVVTAAKTESAVMPSQVSQVAKPSQQQQDKPVARSAVMQQASTPQARAVQSAIQSSSFMSDVKSVAPSNDQANVEPKPVAQQSNDISDTSYNSSAVSSPIDARQTAQPKQGNIRTTVTEATESRQDAKRRYKEDKAQEIIRKAGMVEKPTPVRNLSRANRRFAKSRKAIQHKIKKNILHGKTYKGDAFYETIFSKSDLMPDCVSIGSENLREAIREPNSSIIDIVNEKNPTANLTREECLADIGLLVDDINGTNIEALLEKTPVNINSSIQVRTLRAHYGRGIGLHPTQTKAFNADFDGDPAVLNLNQSRLKGYSRAMTRLVDINGEAMIDPDFFPIDDIERGLEGEITKCLIERNFSWNEDIARAIAPAYIDLCQNPGADNAWVKFLTEIDNVAGRYFDDSASRSKVAARILKSIYDFSTNRRGLSIEAQFADVIDNYEYIERKDLDPTVIALVDLYEEIGYGQPAPNFQDFTVFFNKQYGTFDNKNIPFRLLADFAKAIKRTDLINIGDSVADAEGKTITLYDLYQFTCTAATSKLISGRMYMGSRELAVSTQVKTIVKREAPVPQWDYNSDVSIDEQFRNWIKAFQKSYNSQMRMLNISQVAYRNGMSIIRKGVGRFDGFESIEDCAKALVEVYGEYNVRRLFPNVVATYGRESSKGHDNWAGGVINVYGNMTVAEFSMSNRLEWYSESVGNGKFIPKKDAIANRIKNDNFNPMDILMLVADRRSKQFGDYNKSWLDATSKHASTMKRIHEDIENDRFNEYANDMIEILHLMSPNMFDFFGMDSPVMFAKSKWGKRLIANKSIDDFRSTLLSMMVEYRLARPSQILQSMKDASERADYNSERIDALEAVYENEMETLASSSMAWEAIVAEAIEGDTVFHDLISSNGIWTNGGKGDENTSLNDRWKMNAQRFWQETDLDSQYSLINFLKSSESYETKIAALCDVMRVRTGIKNAITVNTVIGQLAHDPAPLTPGSLFDMDNGLKSSIDAVKDSIDRLSSYKSKAPSQIRKEADKVIKEAKANKVAFEQKLAEFALDPSSHLYVDTIFAADAVASVYDKNYRDSEKIQQQPSVNGYFQILSMQRGGGFYTHLHQTDNAILNVVGFDQLTPFDIVQILGDPDIELHGYDEFGLPCVYSRESLCGGESIDDVIKYLDDNPRIALACRQHVAGISDNVDGSGRMIAVNSSVVNDNTTYKVFSLLNDRPRFFAIAALITPTKQNVGRNIAEHLNDNINELCNFIAKEAKDRKSIEQYIQDIEDKLDFYPDTIMGLRKEGAFDPNEIDETDYQELQNIYTKVIDEMLECIDLVQKSGLPLPIGSGYITESVYPDSHFEIDASSMRAFYDVIQQMTGARTATMIGIEGSETKKNLMLKEFVENRPDRFMTITDETPRIEIDKLSSLTERDLLAELADSDDCVLVIEVPEGWIPEDASLEHDLFKQTGSIAKFLEGKREKSAEAFNAKSKKYGDDNTNSVTKFFKYAKQAMLERYGKKHAWSIEDGASLRQAIESAQSKDEAIPLLADAIMKADARLGYIDLGKAFQKSDYYNLADLMLTQSEEGGPIYIRTLEQLSTAFRNRLSDEAVLSGDDSVVLAELANLADIVGTPNDPMFTSNDDVLHEVLNNVRINSSVGNKYRLDRALRPRSSSTERNYSLVWNIFKKFSQEANGGMRYMAESRKSIVERSVKMFKKLPSATREQLKGIAYPADKFNKEMHAMTQDDYGKRDYIYDYLGRPQDDGFTIIPGPQSLVFFDTPPSNGDNKQVIEECMKYGITAAFDDIANIPSQYAQDAIILDNGIIILPFFDMMLNGSMSSPIAPAPAQIPFDPSNMTVAVENTTYEIKPGDASGHATQEYLDRVSVNYEGDELFSYRELFPNVVKAFGMDSELTLYKCSKKEVERWIINQPELINTEDGCTVDYGAFEGDQGYDRARERFDIRLREYIDRFDEADDYSILQGDCGYDSIIGFAKIEIGRGSKTFAFAPIIPFNLEGTSRVPVKFRASDLYIDYDMSALHMRWKFTGGLEGQYIKYYEGIGASNKLIVHGGETIQSRNLDNGMPVDIMYASKSVASRLFPNNKRLFTMITMMMIPRVDANYAYNFGDLSGAFPGDPTFKQIVKDENGENQEIEMSIKEALRTNQLTSKQWKDIINDNPSIQYHTDPEIDSVVRWLVNKCIDYGTVNPTTLLATKAEGGILQPVYTEFEAFLDTGYNFQNALMKLMHEMTKETGAPLCPPNIDGDASNCLLKPVGKNRTDQPYGTLQMMVPYWHDDGTPHKVPQNVYISPSFFGDEFSGFKQVNFNAANQSIDDINVSSSMDGFSLSQIMAFGRAGMASVPSANSIEIATDGIMVEKENQGEQD